MDRADDQLQVIAVADDAAVREAAGIWARATVCRDSRESGSADVDAALAGVRRRLDLPDASLLLARRAGRTLGFAVVAPRATTLEVVHLAVDPDAWGGGVATRLLAEVETVARAAGRRRLELWVIADNARAIAVYDRSGWHPTPLTQADEASGRVERRLLRHLLDPAYRAPVGLLEDADWAWRRRGPTPRAVDAFGADAQALRRLAGGAGFAWTDGRLVLKPVGCVPEHDWVCAVYAGWRATDVRVPEPVAPRGDHATWSVGGWGAHVWLPGRDLDLDTELDRVKDASDAFHDALRDVPRPAFMNDRDDPWAFGDRVAWEDAEPEGDAATLEVIDRLRSALASVTAPDQPVHGDVLPNVLLADGLPPAVIDWPPYFRPAGTATAIAAVDAVTLRGAPLPLLDAWATGPEWDQLLVRALLYRLGPTGVFAARGTLMGSLVTHVERVRPVVDAVLARAGVPPV